MLNLRNKTAVFTDLLGLLASKAEKINVKQKLVLDFCKFNNTDPALFFLK